MGRSHIEYTSRCVNYWHNLKNIQLNKTENLKQEKQKEKQPFLDFSDISSESNTDTWHRQVRKATVYKEKKFL